MNKKISAAFVLAIFALLALSACTISSNGKEGEDKKVDIKTPFGSLKVDEKVDPRDTGLPLYAGAKPYEKSPNDKGSANVNISSGLFGVKVVVAEFTSPDSPQKVEEFYANALKTYGAIVECKGSYDNNVKVDKSSNGGDNAPVDCSDVHGSNSNEVQLKVGTRNHQHVVAVRPDGSGTRFALVYVNTRGTESGS